MSDSIIKEEGVKQLPWLNIASGLVLVMFVAFTIRYQIRLLDYFQFGDEDETVVAAKMIAAGSSLYSEIFNHHGPLIFLPGMILEKFGNFGVAGHRVPIMILQLIALVAIYFSPVLRDRVVRNIYTGIAASVMVLYLPELFGHTYTYQVMAGLLLTIVFAQYTIPAIACPEKLTDKQIILGNFLIGSLPFLAITYFPIAILLFWGSARKHSLKKSTGWFVAGIGVNILILACIGSIKGYLALHVYLNTQILPLFNDGQGPLKLLGAIFETVTNDLSKFLILTVVVTAIANLASCERRFPWRSIMIGIGIGSLLVRSSSTVWNQLPYFYAGLALPLIFFKNEVKHLVKYALVFSVLSIICLIKLSLIFPADEKKIDSKPIPRATGFSEIAQMFTSKQDKIIAYTFRNYEYIAADRLPASGAFFYLPWQEKYNENPKFGIKIDACKDIAEYRPKIMLVDKWKVWGKYSWDSYAGCIQKIIDKNYNQIPGQPYYVRKDLLPDDMGIAVTPGTYKLQPSAQLSAHSPIVISMTSSHQNDRAGLKRIGIMFGTYMQQNPGTAELRLEGADGARFTQHFSLPDLVDNKYRYFDLDSKRYTSGEISSITGGGISTWDSHGEKEAAHTCITYQYEDGKRRFTPGCPLF